MANAKRGKATKGAKSEAGVREERSDPRIVIGRTPIPREVEDRRTQANALLLSCMDLRMIDETAWLMNELKHHNEYDHVALAGASLGVLTASYKDPLFGKTDVSHIGKTFWTHVDLAVRLHNIEKVIIVEHAECGAYGAFLRGGTLHGRDASGVQPKKPRAGSLAKPPPRKKPEVELAQHRFYANELKRLVQAEYAKTYAPKGKENTSLEVEVYIVTPWIRLDPETAKKEATKKA